MSYGPFPIRIKRSFRRPVYPVDQAPWWENSSQIKTHEIYLEDPLKWRPLYLWIYWVYCIPMKILGLSQIKTHSIYDYIGSSVYPSIQWVFHKWRPIIYIRWAKLIVIVRSFDTRWTDMIIIFFIFITIQIDQNTHWVKNHLRRTGEHNYEFLIFSLEKICVFSISNFFLNKY